MNKIDSYKIELSEKIKDFLDSSDKGVITQFLIDNSNLPGRRANIELANAFASVVADSISNESDKLWNLCLFLISFTPNEANTNDPEEFLPFCGVWAIGAIGAVNPKYYEESIAVIKRLSRDSRWRIREAIAFGIQELLKISPNKILDVLNSWLSEKNWLTYRAIVAGVAHPSILVESEIAERALDIHDKILSIITASDDLTSQEFKICKKGLSYTLSVITSVIPKKGFKLMSQYINTDNKHIQMIIRENLKKNRIMKKFPKEVQALNQKLIK